MVSAVQTPARQVLFRQPILPLLLAVVYLAILIIPWVLTCVISRNPRFLLHKGGFNDDTESFLWPNYSILRMINAFNAITAALSLPLLSMLLARAAVVFSQRRSAKQRLTVRQLFALADHSWWNPFRSLHISSPRLEQFGVALLALALALPILRFVLVSYHGISIDMLLYDGDAEWELNRIGTTPAPGVLSGIEESGVISSTRARLLATSGGIETSLWPLCSDSTNPASTCGIDYNPYDLTQSKLSDFWEAGSSNYDYYEPGYTGQYTTNGSALMFATTVQAGTSTGFVRDEYVLALKSGAMCSSVSSDEVNSQCSLAASSANSGWNTSLYIEGRMLANVCVPVADANETWHSTIGADGKPYTFTEDMYLGYLNLAENDETSLEWSCIDDSGCLGDGDGLYVHCQMNTTLGYVQLGSISSEGVPTRFLNSTPPSFQVPNGTVAGGATGPLMSTAEAMFGNDSWFSVLGEMLSQNADNQTLVNFMSIACNLMPLNNAEYFQNDNALTCSEVQANLPLYSDDRDDLLTLLEGFTHSFFNIFNYAWTARAALNTGAFFANSYLLSAAVDTDVWYAGDTDGQYYYTLYSNDGVQTPPVIPVITLGTMITITILIALQTVAILLLLAYMYRTKVWTTALNAFAMARIGAQLSRHAPFDWAEHSPGILGIGVVHDDRLAELWEMDGLIDTSIVLESRHEPSASAGGGGDVEMADFLPAYSPRGHESGGEGDEEQGGSTRLARSEDPARPSSAGSAPPYVPRADHGEDDEVSEMSEDLGREGRAGAVTPESSTTPALAAAAR